MSASCIAAGQQLPAAVRAEREAAYGCSRRFRLSNTSDRSISFALVGRGRFSTSSTRWARESSHRRRSATPPRGPRPSRTNDARGGRLSTHRAGLPSTQRRWGGAQGWSMESTGYAVASSALPSGDRSRHRHPRLRSHHRRPFASPALGQTPGRPARLQGTIDIRHMWHENPFDGQDDALPHPRVAPAPARGGSAQRPATGGRDPLCARRLPRRGEGESAAVDRSRRGRHGRRGGHRDMASRALARP